jgi:hypothetical protein
MSSLGSLARFSTVAIAGLGSSGTLRPASIRVSWSLPVLFSFMQTSNYKYMPHFMALTIFALLQQLRRKTGMREFSTQTSHSVMPRPCHDEQPRRAGRFYEPMPRGHQHDTHSPSHHGGARSIIGSHRIGRKLLARRSAAGGSSSSRRDHDRHESCILNSTIR